MNGVLSVLGYLLYSIVGASVLAVVIGLCLNAGRRSGR